MTGTVDWTMLLFLLAAVGAGGAAAWWLSETLTTTRHNLRNEFQVKLAEEGEALEALDRAFATYKLHVAETYMSKSSGGMAIDRAVLEIKGLRTDLKDEMSRLGDRIERMETQFMTRGVGNG